MQVKKNYLQANIHIGTAKAKQRPPLVLLNKTRATEERVKAKTGNFTGIFPNY